MSCLMFSPRRAIPSWCLLVAMISMVALCSAGAARCGEPFDGFLRADGRTLFPIGSYELPADDDALGEMAAAGFNLVRCGSKADLDRAAAVGMLGWAPVALQRGDQAKLREQIVALKDHPALAVWEGPDEVVHRFTGSTRLYRVDKIHKTPDAWLRQRPEAVAYAREQAAVILPGLRAGAKLIRELDGPSRPIWMNEAANSDARYVREYVDSVDIIGCDSYPIRAGRKAAEATIGPLVERWKQVGRDRKPVWMVLQAFSWSELGEYHRAATTCYPSFAQSRLMAYQVIVHGGRGILYWGSHYLKSDAFRQSLYALVSELAALQPFLIAPDVEGINAAPIRGGLASDARGVRAVARRVDDQWLLILVNEDPRTYLGTEVTGLDALDGRQLHWLYGDESLEVRQGEIVVRLQPLEVKVFATDRQWESTRREGRDYRFPESEPAPAAPGT